MSLAMEPVAKKSHLWARDGLDWYVEGESCSDALFRVEKFDGQIHDPCCGGGNIIHAAQRAGYSARGSDVVCRVASRPDWFSGERDFIAGPAVHAENIVTNPPFFKAKGAEACIRRALESATGKVCAFVDVKFLASSGRASGLFRSHPPTRIWILYPRPSCPPGEYLLAGEKAGGGTADWCWLVWCPQRTGRAELGWLRRTAE